MGKVRVCLETGCPALGAWVRGRCPTHERANDKARGSKRDRGYDATHDRERARIQRDVDAGRDVRCWRCNVKLIGRSWHLDHSDDRTSYRGPACVKCNLTLAGRKRHSGGRGGD